MVLPFRVGCEVPLSRSALHWVALNLTHAGSPGWRRRLNEAVPGAGAIAAARVEIDAARRIGAAVLTIEDEAYPPLLRAASDPPPVLYAKGGLLRRDALAVAVVGSRRATPNGLRLAREIAAGLAGAGFTVVSGLARGIDAAAHRGALSAGGRTLAVLGCGVDRIYPAEHQKLAEAIAARGVVLSELPLGFGPVARNFPERNRIIAWSCWATVVVEAARDSGSLITANLALQEGRLVYAVPGAVGEPHAEGTNALLREGALTCRGAADVIEDLAPQIVEAARGFAPPAAGAADAGAASENGAGADGLSAPDSPAGPATGPEHRRVLALIPATRGIAVDALVRASGTAAGPLLALLLDLELAGLVRQLPGRRFIAVVGKT